MEELVVWIGSFKTGEDGQQEGDTRPVRFVGEELASSTQYAEETGLWEVIQTLYRREDGRLLVHVKDRSQPDTHLYSLHEATMEDLQPDGRFAGLGEGGWFWVL